MPDREKATTKLACSTCGAELAAQEQPDGSMAAKTCPNCHPKSKEAASKADKRLREKGTLVPGDGPLAQEVH